MACPSSFISPGVFSRRVENCHKPEPGPRRVEHGFSGIGGDDDLVKLIDCGFATHEVFDVSAAWDESGHDDHERELMATRAKEISSQRVRKGMRG